MYGIHNLSAQCSQNTASGCSDQLHPYPCLPYFLVFHSRVSFPECYTHTCPAHLTCLAFITLTSSTKLVAALFPDTRNTEHTPFTQCCTLMHTEQTLTRTGVHAVSRLTFQTPSLIQNLTSRTSGLLTKHNDVADDTRFESRSGYRLSQGNPFLVLRLRQSFPLPSSIIQT